MGTTVRRTEVDCEPRARRAPPFVLRSLPKEHGLPPWMLATPQPLQRSPPLPPPVAEVSAATRAPIRSLKQKRIEWGPSSKPWASRNTFQRAALWTAPSAVPRTKKSSSASRIFLIKRMDLTAYGHRGYPGMSTGTTTTTTRRATTTGMDTRRRRRRRNERSSGVCRVLLVPLDFSFFVFLIFDFARRWQCQRAVGGAKKERE